jgi:hypothetical protein
MQLKRVMNSTLFQYNLGRGARCFGMQVRLCTMHGFACVSKKLPACSFSQICPLPRLVCTKYRTFLVWLYHSAAAPSLIDKLLLYYSTVDASHRTAAVTNQVTCLKQMIFGPACMHNKQDFSWVVTARAHDCLVTHPITPTIDVATKTN